MSEKVAKGEYKFSVANERGSCSCSCPCSSTNPVDVTVVVSIGGKEAESYTIGPENIKKLSV